VATIRANGVAGKLTADLTTSTTTMSSAGLADLPAITSPDIAKVTLFQTDTNGRVTKEEIVYVTTHTASATSATITRAQESTSAQTWNGTSAPDSWVHAPTAADFTSGTSGPTKYLLGTLDATYGDEFTASSLDAKWSRGGNATSGQESFQVDSSPTKTWMRWDRTGGAGGYLYQTAPAGDFSLVMRLSQVAGSACMLGPCIVNSSGDGVMATMYTSPDSVLVIDIAAMAYNSNFAQGKNMSTAVHGDDMPYWLRLRKSSTNYFAAVSFNGEKWQPETSVLTKSFTVARIGFGAAFNGALVDVDVFNLV
jgi:hypothetical protein